ncbi:taurine ABC transporter ATP-binding subunit [Vogesella facilis]|uniref:Taurine ABC transporter ATP-binding subunit n=1 Tax=Vogesella facilis TaxID=1655232 RepID=A0ABV7RHU8_9NEIS
MSLLQVDNLSVHYPGQPLPALQQVSLGLAEDELLVALGPSGCGKSTLLNVLAGFIAPTHGTVQFAGQPVRGPGAERAVVFQHDGLLPWLDVAGNVAFGLKLQRVPAAERAAIVAATLQQVGLADAGGKRIWQLSGGMRQRVGIARALASQSRVLLLDEPFGALDAFTREQMQQLLLQVWQQSRRAVFLITHDIEEALFLASSLVLMSPGPGRIVQYLRPTFSQRFLAGESVRSIKSDPAFITLREELLASLSRAQQQEAA